MFTAVSADIEEGKQNTSTIIPPFGLFDRPGKIQGLRYKHRCDSFIHSLLEGKKITNESVIMIMYLLGSP